MAVDPQQGPTDGWTWTEPGSAPPSFTSAVGQPLATAAHPLTEGEPTGIDAVTKSDLFQHAAYPQTLADFGHLILAPTDITRGAVASLPTVIKAATDLASGAKEQVGNAIMRIAHPIDTMDSIAKHLIGSDAPDPQELDAAKNELAAMRLRLQSARSATRQVEVANGLPAAPEVQSQAKDWLDTINKATVKSPLVDASGKSLSSPSSLSEWDTNFVKNVSDRVKSGWALSGNQVNQLRRIYQAVK